MDLALTQPAVLELELPVITAERASVVLLAICQQPGGEAVLGEDSDTVRGKETGACSVFDVVAAATLQDQALDPVRP
jgi:hypothetical protein